MNKICKAILLIAVFYSGNLFSQEKTISGTVSDDTGTLPGVNIIIKNTLQGTETDLNGNYTIIANIGDILQYSFIGMTTKEIVIGQSNTIDVVLESDNLLDEVVITAMGIARKPNEIAYATTKIDQDEIIQAAPVSVQSALVGKASGLNINFNDNGVNPSTTVRLRANNSLSGNNDALIVIDGIPQSGGALGDINPNDIESVNILKGASSVTLYGSAGSNGALIITTKKGKNNGKLSVSLNSTFTLETVKFFPKLQSKFGSGSTTTFQYDPIENENWGPRYDGTLRQVGPVLADGSFQTLRYSPIKDNRKDFFETGITFQNSISLSGGDDSSSYFFSAQNVERTGITPKDKYKRNNFRFNASKNYGKLETSTSVSFFQDNTNIVGATPQDGSFYRLLLNSPGHIPISDYKNWETDKFSTPDTYYNAYFKNPYQVIDENRDTSRSNRLQGIANFKYEFTDWLSATYTIGGTWFNSEFKNTQAAYVYDPSLTYTRPGDEGNNVADGLANNFRLNSDFILNFNKDFGEDFSTRLILGNHVETFRSNQINIIGNNLFTNIIYNANVRTGQLGSNGAPQGTLEKRLYSFFGDLTVGYRDYLFLTGSYRQDTSSTLLYENNTYGYYSGGISFVATEAIKNLDTGIVDFLKLNLSYAKVGNDAVIGATNENFQVPGGFPFGATAGLRPTTIAVDTNLSPEFSTSIEAGLSAEFLDRRIRLDANYYTVKSEDQISSSAASRGSGATAYLTNIGEIQNKGFEFDLGITPFKTENFQWDLGLTYTTNKSEVIELSEGADRVQVGTGFQNTATIFAQVGQPYPSIFAPGYVRDPQGNVIVDANGNPQATNQFINLGSTVPDVIAGLTTKLRYKDFTVSAVADYKTGHVFYSTLVEALEFAGLTEQSASTNRQPFIFPDSVYETTPGSGQYVENTDRPTSDGNRTFWQNSYNNIKENYVVDASAIKLREVSLNYTLPAKHLENSPINSISFGLVANNVYMWRPKENVYTDPEFSINTGGTGVTGIGSSAEAPPTGTYGFKLNVKF